MAVAVVTPDTVVVDRGLRGQLVRFAAIGAASTVVHLGLLALLTAPLGTQPANLVGLVVSTVGNTAANRLWTFQVRGRDQLARQHLQALLVFAVTWACSSVALELPRRRLAACLDVDDGRGGRRGQRGLDRGPVHGDAVVDLPLASVTGTSTENPRRTWGSRVSARSAEAAGFEPARGVTPNPLSRRAH